MHSQRGIRSSERASFTIGMEGDCALRMALALVVQGVARDEVRDARNVALLRGSVEAGERARRSTGRLALV